MWRGRRKSTVCSHEHSRLPDLSAVMTGRTGKFSIGRLLRCLDRLDSRIDVAVRDRTRRMVPATA
jgi:predicted XRE-type DNA-binding protein